MPPLWQVTCAFQSLQNLSTPTPKMAAITIEPFKSITLTNPAVVAFFSKHSKDEHIMSACEDMLVTICKTAESFMAQQRHTSEQHSILQFLQAMDVRHQHALANVHDKLSQITSDVDMSLAVAGSTVADKVTCQIAGLMNAINQVVSQLDIASIETKMLEASSILMQQQASNVHTEFQIMLRNVININIMDPVLKAHQELRQQLTNLPDSMMTRAQMNDSLTSLQTVVRESTSLTISKLLALENSLLEVNRVATGNTLEHTHSTHHAEICAKLEVMPQLTRGVVADVLSQLEHHGASTNMQIACIQKQLDFVRSDVKDGTVAVTKVMANTEQLQGRIDSIASERIKTAASAKHKGSEAEDILFEQLSSVLLLRDGYAVDKVGGLASSCDIAIKREGYPTVRIESKAIGKDTNEKVRKREVDKFIRDLMTCDNHGIFVSIHSSIVGIANMELQQLANGKFAVFLARNNYDVDQVVSMLQLLYKLDSILLNKSAPAEMTLSAEAMTRLQKYLKDFGIKLDAAKRHMRESVTMLNEIQLELVEKLLLGQLQQHDTPHDTKSQPFACQLCKSQGVESKYKNKRDLTRHLKTCTFKCAADQHVKSDKPVVTDI